MSDYQFWDELGNIFNAVLAYQKKTIEFNKRFVNPWVQLGPVFEPQDDLTKALHARRQAIEIDPDNAENFQALGDLYFKNGQMDDAESAYLRTIELNPQAGWAYANLALTQFMRQQYEDSIRLYLQSLEFLGDQKDRAMVWNRLGNAYRRINEYENACKAFQMADECDAGNTGFFDRLDSDPMAQDIAGDEDAILPSEMPEDIVLVAPDELTGSAVDPASEETLVPEILVQEAEEQEVSEALPELFDPEEVISEEDVQPEETEAQPVVMEEKNLQPEQDAIADPAETTITPMPVHENGFTAASSAIVETTLAFLEQGEPALAEESNAGTSTDFTSETQMLDSEDKPDETVDAVEEIEVTSEAIVSSAVEIEEERVEDADSQSNESIIQEIISLAGRDAVEPVKAEEAESTIAEPVVEEAPVEPVLSSPEWQAEPDTKNAHVWNELGNVYFDSGAYEEAIAAYTKAIELDVRFAWSYSNLALAYVQKEKFNDAILLYQRSIELFKADTEKAVTFNRLGNVYRRLNDYDNAITSYQRADELDPNNATRSLRSRFSLLGSLSLEQSPSMAI